MNILQLYSSQKFSYAKLFFQRGLGFIYLIAFLILFNQGKALIGENGLTPAYLYLERINFWDSPSIFFLNSSDALMMGLSFLGIVISLLALLGVTEKFGYLISAGSWFTLWLLYLSFVNIGQVWYGYGWESLLLETGFLAIFLGHKKIAPPMLIIWALRWVCFRNFVGAGMIKLRGDECWRDLTCMYKFYETQPIPNPLSIYFHYLPQFIHKASVIGTFIVELIIPFGMLAPWGFIVGAAGLLMVALQSLIVMSGNLSWLNYLSIVLIIPCFNDAFIKRFIPFHLKELELKPPQTFHRWAVYILGCFLLWLSWMPLKNLFSERQAMNRSYDRFRIVNTYGNFAAITKKRNELVVLGTMDIDPKNAVWKEYEFKGKPTDPNRVPSIMSPYQWKICWQMWFAAFGDYRYSPWVLNMIAKLLQAQPEMLGLISKDPFNGKKPKWIKVDFYNYTFKNLNEKGLWNRKYLRPWIFPLNLENEQFKKILKTNKWI